MEFVTRKNDELMCGGKPFRFVSLNAPSLTVVEDPEWHRADEFEQEDAIKTIAQMGGKVVRVYCFSVSGCAMPKPFYHVNAPGDYNEELFRDFDRMLMLCNKHGVRVIVPFVDNWHWWGGIKEWAAFRGKTEAGFFTDETVKSDFKALIKYVLNRKNTYTGVLYKDDPAILCWETGNELEHRNDDLQALTAWTQEMAAYIKEQDNRHLLMDGRYLRWSPPEEVILADSNLDILTVHYYSDQPLSYADSIRRDAGRCRGRKPLVLGEFGMIKSAAVSQLLQACEEEKVTGVLAWSLRFRNKEGGFYWHHEVHPEDDVYNAYHWPGFPSNAGCEEEQVLKLMYQHAWLVDGKAAPELPRPTAPQLTDCGEGVLSWRGSVGARHYELQRQQPDGSWLLISDHLVEYDNPFLPFVDSEAVPGEKYSYRLRAVNESGKSEWSAARQI